MLNAVEHMNFFEGRSTEYSKASTQGTWTEAFEDLKSPYFDMLEKNKISVNQNFSKEIILNQPPPKKIR